MSPDTGAILEYLEQKRTALKQAVDSIPASAREQRPGPERWSVAEVLEHLAIVERRVVGRLNDALTAARAKPAPAGGAAPAAGLDERQLAQLADRSQRFKTSEASEPRGGLTAAAAWTALEEARAELNRLVRESDGLALAETIAPHPRFGPWTFRQWATFVGGHDARHADQIREMGSDQGQTGVRPGSTQGQTPIAASVLHAIGRTPVVRLRAVVPPGAADVLVKLEFYNPTGSYKDRMALAMIEGAERRGVLKTGMRVVEFTGGSTGSSLGMVCAAKGYRLILLSSDAFAEEKLKTMRAFGADLRLLPSEGGKVTPALFDRFRKEIAILAAEPGTFWTDQFHNEDAIDGYAGIGRELLEQTGGALDVFCGAVGTGGMLKGVIRGLREGGEGRSVKPIKIVALEPATSPAMTAGHSGAHRVEGIATGSIPPHMADKPWHEARAVREEEARAMARRLAREEGLLVGTSSALNIVAAIEIARELGQGHVVATVAVDTGLKYLAGDLFEG